MNEPDSRIEILQGTPDMLILRTLLVGPAHGHQIAKHVQRTIEDVLQVEHGSLYPALHKLERKGWLAAKWEKPRNGKREFKLQAHARWQEATCVGLEESKWKQLVRANRTRDHTGRGGLK